MKLIFNSDYGFTYPYEVHEEIISYLSSTVNNEIIVEIKISIYTVFSEILVKIIIYTKDSFTGDSKKMKSYKKIITIKEYMKFFDSYILKDC